MVAGAASLVVLAAMGAAGVAALRRWAGWLEPLEQFAYGVPLGVVAASLVLLALAIAFGLSAALVAFVGLASAAGAVVLWPERAALAAWPVAARERLACLGGRSPESVGRAGLTALRKAWLKGTLAPTLVVVAFALRWLVFWRGALTLGPDGLVAGQINIWGDWMVHLDDVATFAYGDNFPPQHPRFAGIAYAYHYLPALTAAALVKLGMTPWAALTLHSFVFSVLIALGLYAFARRLTRDRGAAALALVLFLLGGGLGWVLVLAKANGAHDLWGTLLHHTWDQGQQAAANFQWQTTFYAFIAPERGYLYGLPLALLIFTALFVAVQGADWRPFLVAGVAAGLLPLAHLSTLLALALIAPFLFLLFPSWRWGWFFVPWAALAAPQLLAQQGGLRRGATSALRLKIGWIAAPDSWPWFWLKNLGWFIPLVVVALLARDLLPPRARRFLLGFMPLFALTNLVVFQPWDWDNEKFMVYWFLAVCVAVAALLARAWRERPAATPRFLIAGVVATMILSGVLVDWQQLSGQDRHQLLNPEEVHLAALVRAETPPRAIVAVGLQYNHPITVLGDRVVMMSYPGWLWTQGLDYAQRERDLRAIYAFAPDAPALLRRYNVSYVVIGPAERQDLQANEAAFRARYPVAISTEHYEVFKVGP
ncbi:MAG TPA: hypothetical protein VFL91_12500 [Thermomicrobiales bacterium]|nr:hypothetical protein [Thermomicrobiales bacterium]